MYRMLLQHLQLIDHGVFSTAPEPVLLLPISETASSIGTTMLTGASRWTFKTTFPPKPQNDLLAFLPPRPPPPKKKTLDRSEVCFTALDDFLQIIVLLRVISVARKAIFGDFSSNFLNVLHNLKISPKLDACAYASKVNLNLLTFTFVS